MGKLICILGKSGAGKDTLFKKIIEASDISVTPVIPYTTRPKRANESEGVQYHFVSEREMLLMEQQDQIVEKREYNTVNGVWYYFTAACDISRPENFIMITTPGALERLAVRFGGENIVAVFLDASDRVRLLRSIDRESRQAEPNYAELCRRYLADEEDFRSVDRGRYHAHFTIDADGDIGYCLEQFKGIMHSL